MKRVYKKRYVLSNTDSKATIVIDKNGLRVEDMVWFDNASEVIRAFLSDVIDMDSWQHSWHMDISKAQRTDSNERKRVAEIIKDKIHQREDDIRLLKDALNILRKWN